MKENVAEFLGFRFERLKLLKRSDKGEVWLASSKQSGELVIIKRVALTGLPYDVLKNFSFKLPAKILFCAEDKADTVIVEEFIQGESLLERLEQKNFLNELQAREILLQMCDGLKELHEQKIIHRDIKPSNMILQGERLSLIDFDAARIFKEGQETDTKLLGTKGYAPPEQFGSGQTDNRSDIYSLGVTMKNLLGGHCSGRLKKILDKCTELDPKNRFQSVDELKLALTTEEPKKFRASLICLMATGILFVNAPTLNLDENFTEEITIQAEEIISKPEDLHKPQKISTPAQVSEFELPKIVKPPQKEFFLPNIEPPKKYAPPPRKIFSEDDLKLPEVELPTAPSYEPPINYERPPLKTFLGVLKTEFYLNGALFNQEKHKNDREKISRADWQRAQVRLHITNETGELWQNPTIKFIFSPNWGGDPMTETKSLTTLNIGESADFIISFDSYELPDKDRLSVCLQIYLEGEETKMDEHYWCVWFDIAE